MTLLVIQCIAQDSCVVSACAYEQILTEIVICCRFFALYKGLLPKVMRLGPGKNVFLVHLYT